MELPRLWQGCQVDDVQVEREVISFGLLAEIDRAGDRQPAIGHPAAHVVERDHLIADRQPARGALAGQAQRRQADRRPLEDHLRRQVEGVRVRAASGDGLTGSTGQVDPDRSVGLDVFPDVLVHEGDGGHLLRVGDQVIGPELEPEAGEVGGEVAGQARETPARIIGLRLEVRAVGSVGHVGIETLDHHLRPAFLVHGQPAVMDGQGGVGAALRLTQRDARQRVAVGRDAVGDRRAVEDDPPRGEPAAQQRAEGQVGRDPIDGRPGRRIRGGGLVQCQAGHARRGSVDPPPGDRDVPLMPLPDRRHDHPGDHHVPENQPDRRYRYRQDKAETSQAPGFHHSHGSCPRMTQQSLANLVPSSCSQVASDK